MAALAVSLLAHVAMFSIAHLGSELHWWDARPFAIFRKVRITPEEAAKLIERQRQREAERPPPEPPMLFVQVTQPSPDTPEKSEFYSSVSSRAANPEPSTLEQPRIDGNQTRDIRLENAPRVPAGRPTPPPEPEEQPGVAEAPPQTVETQLIPPPEEVLPPVDTRLVPVTPEPERKKGLGELALPTPPVPTPPPEPKPELPKVLPEEPPPQPQPTPPPPTPPPPEPVPTPVVASVPPTPTPTPAPPTPSPRPRPKTLTEARLRQELLAGEKVKQEGGVARQGPVSLDVKGTPFGAYDEMLVLAVQNRWFRLLEEQRYVGGVQGSVVVTFRLHSDGTVRIVEPSETSVDALFTGLCVRAISDPSPYEKWPSDMLRMLGKPMREMRFTFRYNH